MKKNTFKVFENFALSCLWQLKDLNLRKHFSKNMKISENV